VRALEGGGWGGGALRGVHPKKGTPSKIKVTPWRAKKFGLTINKSSFIYSFPHTRFNFSSHEIQFIIENI